MDIDNLAQKADEIHKSIYGETVNDTVLDNLEDNDDLLASNDLENEDEPSPAPAPDKKFEDLEQKYKALKGRYEAETERMSQLLSSAFSEKERLAAELEARVAPGNAPANLGEDELAEFQTEYPTIYKGLETLLDKKLGEKLKKTEEVVSSVAQTANSLQQDSYFSNLDGSFPQWREIKDNPDFHKWLSVHDPYTGRPRFQLLVDADSQRNHSVVANIYKGFAAESKLLKDEGATPADNAPQPVVRNVSPSTAGNQLPSSGAQKGFITRSEINQIYQNRMKGQYSDEEFAKVEAKIFKMAREGKVR